MAMYAANVLGQLGTEPARQALLGALTRKDADLATVAGGGPGRGRHRGPVKTALLSGGAAQPRRSSSKLMGQLLQAGEPEGMRMAEELLKQAATAAPRARRCTH